ncbi:hypothetical protein MMC16_004181 [Acarospora aff. strigata]|nr:hypothetical protein [Acarospora aff. strigata]
MKIFRSESEGIITAKGARDGSGVLAVDDIQVVILHDIKKIMKRSYRLKGSDVRLMAPKNRKRLLSRMQTARSIPLTETTHKLDFTAPPHNTIESPNKTTERTRSHSIPQTALDRKLEEVKTALAIKMSSFQAEIRKDFQAHKRQMEDTFAR